MIGRIICVVGGVVTAAALWTGAQHGRFFVEMTGFFPPHYGYSAYWMTALLLLTPSKPVRWVTGAALLLSGNRAAWVGAIAGWAWRGGRRRAALALFLGAAAVIGGLAMKPYTTNDSVRIQIWRTAVSAAKAHPEGIGTGNFAYGVAGRVVNKAHSDVLQLWVEQGAVVAAVVLVAVILGLWLLPESPAKDVVIALTVTSIIDNRLHHPACVVLYGMAWLAAAQKRRLVL